MSTLFNRANFCHDGVLNGEEQVGEACARRAKHTFRLDSLKFALARGGGHKRIAVSD